MLALSNALAETAFSYLDGTGWHRMGGEKELSVVQYLTTRLTTVPLDVHLLIIAHQVKETTQQQHRNGG